MTAYKDFNFEEGEVLLFDKPLGWTSFDVVRKIRNTIKIKKVGHAGTLDPLATGLLVLCTGKKTKQIDLIQATEKEYLATVTLGKTTPSYDLETDFDTETDISHLQASDLETALKTFIGTIQQTPPIYSALKVDGQRLYDLARAGKEVEIKSREVTIHSIEIQSIQFPNIVFLLRCSKGTYVRSLASDLGQKLGVGAHLSALRRTKVGDLSVENAYDVPTFVAHIKGLRDAGLPQS